MKPSLEYALSLKQPWAALLVHGLKTIEVRRWPTARRGRILIHAAGVPDPRPEVWRHVPEALRDLAQLQGGVVGAAEMVNCQSYESLDDFVKDQEKHLNDPAWYEPKLYGFTFANPEVLPFRAYPGWMRFFPVGAEPFRGRRKS